MTEKTRLELRLVLRDLPHEGDACVARLEARPGRGVCVSKSSRDRPDRRTPILTLAELNGSVADNRYRPARRRPWSGKDSAETGFRVFGSVSPPATLLVAERLGLAGHDGGPDRVVVGR